MHRVLNRVVDRPKTQEEEEEEILEFDSSDELEDYVGTAEGGGGAGKPGEPVRLGPEGGHDLPGDARGDLFRVAAMLKRIRRTLNGLVFLKPRIIAASVQTQLANTWPIVNGYLRLAIARLELESETALGHYLQQEIYGQLMRVGMTGDMLRMKEASLNYALNSLDRTILSPPADDSFMDRWMARIFRFGKPGCEVMNSVLGSVLGFIPGGHTIKEFKEHVASSYAIAEAIKTQGEESES